MSGSLIFGAETGLGQRGGCHIAVTNPAMLRDSKGNKVLSKDCRSLADIDAEIARLKGELDAARVEAAKFFGKRP